MLMSLLQLCAPNTNWMNEVELFRLLKWYHIQTLCREKFMKTIDLCVIGNLRTYRFGPVNISKKGFYVQ